jgi:hypothetical protein
LIFDYQGYELNFIQKKRCRDNSAHLFTIIYKFYSPITGLIYIVNAEYHLEDIFSIKFYPKQYRHSDFKYNRITNKGDLGNILVTCAKLIPILLQEYPTASFGFISSRTVDKNSKKTEPLYINQRFKVYRYFASIKFGTKTFEHFEYPKISGYLLINKFNTPIDKKERAITKMFLTTYTALPDLVI